MLNRSGEGVYPWLVSDLREKAFSFSLLNMMYKGGKNFPFFPISSLAVLRIKIWDRLTGENDQI